MKAIFLSIVISLLVGCSATPTSNTTPQTLPANKANEVVVSHGSQAVLAPNVGKKTSVSTPVSISSIEKPATDSENVNSKCLFDPNLIVYRCPPNDPAIAVSSNNCKQQAGSFYYCESVLTTTSPASSYTGGVGGSVSVRGYFRKDGTYVRSHTRRSPRRR